MKSGTFYSGIIVLRGMPFSFSKENMFVHVDCSLSGVMFKYLDEGRVWQYDENKMFNLFNYDHIESIF